MSETLTYRLVKGSSLTWAEGDANTENLGHFTQTGTGAVEQTLWDKLRELPISVMDFGATGDGTTDDAAAIQAAVDSLAGGGGTIFFPKPDSCYIIGTAINLSNVQNLTLVGVGGAEFNPQGYQSRIKAKATLTGPMFTTDTAPPNARTGSIVFERLYLDGNNQNVDGYYIHGDSASNAQARMLEFKDCCFQGLRNGLWLGDYTNETPNLTYILGANVYRCIFTDCVYPIKCDAGAFDGMSLDQVWIADPGDRTLIAFQCLTTGQTTHMKHVWFSLGANATYGVYFPLPNEITITDCAWEGNAGTETFVSLYQGAAAASLGGVVVENCRIQSVAGATAIEMNNPAGMEIRSSTIDGNIIVGAGCIVMADNVLFSSGTYTGTTANVYINGEASGTWTPTISFATPGDLTVAYSVRVGTWSKVGGVVTAWFEIATSTFTHTTASGNLIISGLPYTSVASRQTSGAIGAYGGITSAGYDHMGTLMIGSSTTFNIYKSGSGVATGPVTAAVMPTGGTVVLYGQVSYRTATI